MSGEGRRGEASRNDVEEMREAPLLLRGGRVIDPRRGMDQTADVLIQDRRVSAVAPTLGTPDGARVRDVRGKVVVPGLIDVHVHLREPGNEDEETIATGARAAAAGGFTAVCAMPNTDPVTDNQAAVGFIVRQSLRAGFARVYPVGAISLGQKGDRLAEFGEMVGAGAVAVSDDGRPVASSHLMRTALEYARSFDIPVADHCEDPTLSAGGAMHEGLVATRLGLKGIPAAAEEIMVARDCLLAELTGGHVHLCHISARGSVELIRRAKERGARVSAEVTPHHLTLTDLACERFDTNAKMNPPLREAPDIAALRAALKEGVLDCIASDHAPHAYDEKEAAFDDAPFGVVGLETAFAVAHTELVQGGVLSLPQLIERMSAGAARAFNLPGGTLDPGAPADVAVLDVTARWTVDPASFHSKSRNTPFGGRELIGRAVLTIVNGRAVHDVLELPD
ncbi:MAG TPA: dihydroorotase [Gemmatimonadales bacterium]